MSITYRKKILSSIKKAPDSFDQMFSPFQCNLSPIGTLSPRSKSVFPKQSTPFKIMNTSLNKLNLSGDFQETSLLNESFSDLSYNDTYINAFDFNSEFFNSENVNDYLDKINSRSDLKNIKINQSCNSSEDSILEKTIFDYVPKSVFQIPRVINGEFFRSIKNKNTNLKTKPKKDKPYLPESIKEERIPEKCSKTNSSTGKLSIGACDQNMSLKMSKKIKSLVKPDDLDDSKFEVEKKFEHVTVRRKDGNCFEKRYTWKYKFKDMSFHKKAGNQEPGRKISSALMDNKRLTLCRRQSYRVIPIIETFTNQPTFFKSLYTKNIPEETFDHLFLDETDITSNQNLSSPLGATSIVENTWMECVLCKCDQTEILDFDTFYQKYSGKCKKIGEGAFGEVFGCHDGERKTVMKVIPIEGDQLVNQEPQKNFQEIFSEIIITQELSKLRKRKEFQTSCFIELLGCYCVKGKYPNELLILWHNYDAKNQSENDSPDMFADDQLYIVLELDYGGLNMEEFQFTNSLQTISIFKQVTFALAVAECSLEFEHRDLHWGNLLISKTNQIVEDFTLFDKKYSVPTNGVKVTIIDFTLSRMIYGGCYVFNDLATDPSLFTSTGDYQFEIYPKMQVNVGNVWSSYVPFNNILWIHYLLDKMKNEVRYIKITSKTHIFYLTEINKHLNEVLNSESATAYSIKHLAPSLV